MPIKIIPRNYTLGAGIPSLLFLYIKKKDKIRYEVVSLDIIPHFCLNSVVCFTQAFTGIIWIAGGVSLSI